MADDPLDAILADVRTELARLDPDQGWGDSDARWAVGKVKHDRAATPPRVSWVEQFGTIAGPDVVGGETGNVATDLQEFEVTVWHGTKGDCRATLHNLILAVRNTVFGANATFGPSYEWLDDANMNKGRALRINISIAIPVTQEAQPTAIVETVTHETSIGDEVVC